MENFIMTDKEKNTISGLFHIERGGGPTGGKLSAIIEISDMTPLDVSRIQGTIERLSEEIIHGLCMHIFNR